MTLFLNKTIKTADFVKDVTIKILTLVIINIYILIYISNNYIHILI